ncbi:GntR family transcriptional regulator [Pusillimonas noertemannii]|uniref:GntR family transcriptional regulator n=1 Tax=Pusillimonas noertemannii TaxID=305977 RepID=A0A2U1CN67_9BURK|nr:GntR family transcriptional regulator [Pusillimonas noertemannii]NYT68586.1 GntR family transcriptional regulator [Pusillimonas noertemannii]PVY62397.1 GntR family transcriptional regulator [Pusillimonas noertemannii]
MPSTSISDTHHEEARLSSSSPLPLYHRVYLLLRERIVNSTYGPGDTLPSEAELMNAFGVSRITVQRALNTLAGEGFVTRARGRGTTVTQEAASLQVDRPIAASMNGLLVNLSNIGQGTTVKLIHFGYQRASRSVAQALDIEPGTSIQKATRVRFLRGEPFSQSVSHVIEEVGRSYSRKDLETHTLIGLIQRARVIHRVEQSIVSTLADDTQARLLQTHVGAPLLKLSRVFFDPQNLPINVAEIYYHPDRFEFRVTWTRDADNQMQVDLHSSL